MKIVRKSVILNIIGHSFENDKDRNEGNRLKRLVLATFKNQ